METVGTLAGGLVHDFNNILSGITGPLSLINYRLEKHAGIKPEVFSEYLKLMYDSSIKAADIIRRLLSLSRKQEMSFTGINLNTSVSNVMKICRTAFDKSVIPKPEYYPEDAVAIADPAQIEQVLLNMCVNAEHAMTIMKDERNKWGGTLLVAVEKILVDPVFRNSHPEAVTEEYWLLSVNDTGVGIKPEVIPFILLKIKVLAMDWVCLLYIPSSGSIRDS